jgi:hypothetical protein
MGANLLVLASTLLLPTIQHDSISFSNRPAGGIAYERLSDIVQYNRVQGLSLGIGYRTPVPASRSAAAYGTIRYGLSDERITWRVGLVQELRRGRLALSGSYDVVDLDPYSPGRTLSNSLNAVFAGHDNADYALARGGSATWETAIGQGIQLELSAGIERQNTVSRVASSAVNDFLGGSGVFPLNPVIRDGTFGTVSAGLSGRSKIRWRVAADLLGGSAGTAARAYGKIGRRFGSAPQISIQLKSGVGGERGLPQTLFRLGGLNTVRGFDYGTRREPAFWTAQTDMKILKGRVTPVLFLDAGQAASFDDLLSTKALVGGGVGVSALRGLIRFDLSRRLTGGSGRKLRFDLVIGTLD